MANHDDDNLVVIQARVPLEVKEALIELQHEKRDLYLSVYCRRVLIEHVENKRKEKTNADNKHSKKRKI